MLKGYPGLGAWAPRRWESAVAGSMHLLRRELLDDLEAFEKKFRAAPADDSFKLWLGRRQALYEAWLARL